MNDVDSGGVSNAISSMGVQLLSILLLSLASSPLPQPPRPVLRPVLYISHKH